MKPAGSLLQKRIWGGNAKSPSLSLGVSLSRADLPEVEKRGLDAGELRTAAPGRLSLLSARGSFRAFPSRGLPGPGSPALPSPRGGPGRAGRLRSCRSSPGRGAGGRSCWTWAEPWPTWRWPCGSGLSAKGAEGRGGALAAAEGGGVPPVLSAGAGSPPWSGSGAADGRTAGAGEPSGPASGAAASRRPPKQLGKFA